MAIGGAGPSPLSPAGGMRRKGGGRCPFDEWEGERDDTFKDPEGSLYHLNQLLFLFGYIVDNRHFVKSEHDATGGVMLQHFRDALTRTLGGVDTILLNSYTKTDDFPLFDSIQLP